MSDAYDIPAPEVDVTVLVPVYNEKLNLPELYDEVLPVMEELGRSFELLFVDDGSTDGSDEVLAELHRKDARVRVIRFARNFGQQMANTAGLRHTRGRAVVLMDADLQCPAENIPLLLDKLEEGYDIVYGRRAKVDAPLYRRIGSRIASKLIRHMTGFNIPDSASGQLALSEDLVRNVNQYNEKTRYLNGLFAWLSYGRAASVPVSRRRRRHGQSKYTPWMLVQMVLTYIFNFSFRPIEFMLWIGLGVEGLAALVGVRWLYLLYGEGWRGAENTLWAALILAVMGGQIVVTGVVAQYVGRIFREVRGWPPYVITDIMERRGDEPSGPEADPA